MEDPMQAMEDIVPTRDPGDEEQGPANRQVTRILHEALAVLLEGEDSLPRIAREYFAATLILVNDAGTTRLAHFHGERTFFPADLVSLFYLAGVYLLKKSGGIPYDQHVERDIIRMVRGRNTDAANLLLDRITGTLSGPELPGAKLEIFARRRGRLDELLRGIGISGTRCVQKIWDRPPYGRDAQFLGSDQSGANRITANATALLLSKILLGKVGGADFSREILDLLWIEEAGRVEGPEPGLRLVCGLPGGSRAWGQRAAGPRLLHEASAVQLPGGPRYVLVVLSYLGEKYQDRLRYLGGEVARAFGEQAG
jgi:hypothetical protein